MSTATILPLPPQAAIATAVAELSAGADQKRLTALDKAQFDLALGMTIAIVPGAFLMPSSSRSGLIHRVSHLDGCNCEAGRNGRQCRHKVIIEIIEQANTHTMPSLPQRLSAARSAAYVKALAEMNELF
jgi:hypothetical protein